MDTDFLTLAMTRADAFHARASKLTLESAPSIVSEAWLTITELERDCMIMALRLHGENPDTFAPETRECMNRWRPKVEALLKAAA